jgi:hypothetical protein
VRSERCLRRSAQWGKLVTSLGENPIMKRLIVVACVIACASVLSACGHTQPPPTAPAPINTSPPPPPPPPKHWYKQGASTEEFQRTRARCIMNAEMSDGGDAGRWTVIFATCMRAEGWVLQ